MRTNKKRCKADAKYNEYSMLNLKDTSGLYYNGKMYFEYSVFFEIIEFSKNGAVILNTDFEILYVNSIFTRIIGYSKKQLIGKRITDISEDNMYIFTNILQNIKNKKVWTGEIKYIDKEHREHFFSVETKIIEDVNCKEQYYIWNFTDITDLKSFQKSINYLKEYDALTGLLKKWMFIRKLQQRIKKLEGKNKLLAVVTLGLDDFKFINDVMGHLYGDKLLKNISIRLQNIDKNYILSRITGDEFAIILTECNSVKEIEKMIEKVNLVFLNEFIIKQQEVFVTASIGVSIYPIDSLNANDLIMNAISAQHYVKKNGKDNYKMYSEDISKSACERMEMIAMLRHAVDNGEFVLAYQPQVNLMSGNVIGVEALIRWKHPTMGLIYPDKFIPLAEKTGLIVPMGRWVIAEACKQNKVWHDCGFQSLIVSINLSAIEFEKKDLVDNIKHELNKYKLSPEYLEIEITESVLMEDIDQAIKTLCELKKIGIKIAIDDFGTGYSSLNYLKEFPIDRLKIDKSFITGIPNKDNGSIASIIIELAKSLDLKVVAEGTETEDHVKFLKEKQCDTIQGYYFSKPISKENFTHILKDGKSLYKI